MKNYKINVAGITDKGPVMKINQDAYVFKTANVSGCFAGMFAVADGVGGLQNSERASQIAISNLNVWWASNFPNLIDNEQALVSSLADSVRKSNQDILNFSEQCGKKSGTTLSVLVLHRKFYYIIHIGDSRVYRIRFRIEQLTLDHSCTIQKKVCDETVQKSVLTQCLGVRKEIKLYIKSGRLAKNDMFLVCSDGVYKKTESREIAAIVKKDIMDPQEACTCLVEKARTNLELDNITAVVARVIPD